MGSNRVKSPCISDELNMMTGCDDVSELDDLVHNTDDSLVNPSSNTLHENIIGAPKMQKKIVTLSICSLYFLV